MSKSTLRRLSKTMSDDEALAFLSTHFSCVAKLEAENEALKTELRTERKGHLAALLDVGAITLEQYEDGMKQVALLTGGSAEKQFAQSLSKRTTPLSDEEKRNALTGESDEHKD